jgi:hypothetical protein
MVRKDAGYENQPVEIVKNYGIGVIVVSHAELEDGYSWEYVQNEKKRQWKEQSLFTLFLAVLHFDSSPRRDGISFS